MKGLSIFGRGAHANHILSLFSSFAAHIPIEQLELEELGNEKYRDAVVAVGDNKLRFDFSRKARCLGLRQPSFWIHTDSILISEDNLGIQAFMGCICYPTARIGENCILNTSAIIEHHASIGAATHIGPASVILGSVTIGNQCMIGAGSIVLPKLSIADGVTVGASSLVIKDLASKEGVYFGNPARQR